MTAAKKFAELQGFTDFKASLGWLNRFKQRHTLSNKSSHGEALDADDTGVEDFCKKLTVLVSKDVSLPSSGITYRSSPMPEPTARPLRKLWIESIDSDNSDSD